MKHETGAPRSQATQGRPEARRRGASAPAADGAGNDHAKDDLVGRGIRQWRNERPDLDSSGKAVVAACCGWKKSCCAPSTRFCNPSD